MKMLYKYPQAELSYAQLEAENQRRNHLDSEFELIDTGVFKDNRYFDVLVEYAKANPKEILIRISITNCDPETKSIHLLPTLRFCNTQSWNNSEKPVLRAVESDSSIRVIKAKYTQLGQFQLYCDVALDAQKQPALLFTENATNYQRLFGIEISSPYVKDGISNYVVNSQTNAVNPAQEGTKAATHYILNLAVGETEIVL